MSTSTLTPEVAASFLRIRRLMRGIEIGDDGQTIIKNIYDPDPQYGSVELLSDASTLQMLMNVVTKTFTLLFPPQADGTNSSRESQSEDHVGGGSTEQEGRSTQDSLRGGDGTSAGSDAPASGDSQG